jgi:hypothetical protein
VAPGERAGDRPGARSVRAPPGTAHPRRLRFIDISNPASAAPGARQSSAAIPPFPIRPSLDNCDPLFFQINPLLGLQLLIAIQIFVFYSLIWIATINHDPVIFNLPIHLYILPVRSRLSAARPLAGCRASSPI